MKSIKKFTCIFLFFFMIMFITKYEHTVDVDYNDTSKGELKTEQCVEEEVIEEISVSLSDGKDDDSFNKNQQSNNHKTEANNTKTENVDKQENDYSSNENKTSAHKDGVTDSSTQKDAQEVPSKTEKYEEKIEYETTYDGSEKETVKKEPIEPIEKETIQSDSKYDTTVEVEKESETSKEMEEIKQEDKMNYQTPFEIVSNMKAGINIGNALDAYGNNKYDDITKYETQWHNPVITESLFKYIKKIGFNTVRIPVTWDTHILEDGTIDKRWFERVKQVVDYAYKYDLYVIINVHHDKWYNTEYSNLNNALKMTESVWTQIAEYFKDYDSHLIFEGFNEPRIMCGDHDIEFGTGNPEAYDVINHLNAKFVEVVRKTGGNNKVRALMIAGYCAGSDKKVLDAMYIPDDENLILSCHFYEPHKFTSEEYSLSSWNASDYTNTVNMDYKLNTMYKFSAYNNIPVVVTEFGATDKNNLYCREEWCKYFVNKAKEYGISYIWWDNNCHEDMYGLYGIIDREKLTMVFPTIIKILTGYSQ